eukprot:3902647-Pyramimonas_sp.AAC.1
MQTKRTRDGRVSSPEMFGDLMQPVSAREWGEYWRTKKKGTAPGKSGLQCNRLRRCQSTCFRSFVRCAQGVGGACRRRQVETKNSSCNPQRARQPGQGEAEAT